MNLSRSPPLARRADTGRLRRPSSAWHCCWHRWRRPAYGQPPSLDAAANNPGGSRMTRRIPYIPGQQLIPGSPIAPTQASRPAGWPGGPERRSAAAAETSPLSLRAGLQLVGPIDDSPRRRRPTGSRRTTSSSRAQPGALLPGTRYRPARLCPLASCTARPGAAGQFARRSGSPTAVRPATTRRSTTWIGVTARHRGPSGSAAAAGPGNATAAARSGPAEP